MMTGRVKGTAFAFLLFGALGLAKAPGIAAQERPTDCRCVDRDGTEIENCVCVRMPRMDRIVMAPWSAAQDRPRLGISLDISAQAEAGGGARISGVLDDGPAARAGLREGDIVTGVEGRSLAEPLDAARERGFDPDGSLPAQRLLALARELEPGDRLDIEYLRDGEPGRVTVEAEDLESWGRAFDFSAPDWDAEAFGERMRSLSERMRELRGLRAPRPPRPPDAPPHGLEMASINPDLGGYFGAERGVLVTALHSRHLRRGRAGRVPDPQGRPGSRRVGPHRGLTPSG